MMLVGSLGAMATGCAQPINILILGKTVDVLTEKNKVMRSKYWEGI